MQLNYHYFKKNQSEKPQKENKPFETTSNVYEHKEATKEETSEPVSEDNEIEPILKKQKISKAESILSEIEPMEKTKLSDLRSYLNTICNLTSFPLEETMYFISIKNHWALNFLLFCIICSKHKKLTLKSTQKF